MQDEVYGTRDLTFSAWHRTNSTKRFVGYKNAIKLSMIDLDAAVFVEWEESHKEPIAIIEAAIDHGQYKCAKIVQRMAQRADIYGILLLYTISNQPNPADPKFNDIDQFRVKLLHPGPIQNEFTIFTPKQWAESLVQMRNFAKKQIDGKIGMLRRFSAKESAK